MIFTFSFDDGYKSWVDTAKILEKHDFRGTFNTVLRNVVPRRIETRPRMFPPHAVITWNELKLLQAKGHEIGCHGTRHLDLCFCNKKELWMEIVASKHIFKSYGIDVSTFACPFNNFTKEVNVKCRRSYSSVRRGVGVNKLPISSRFYWVLNGGEAIATLEEAQEKNLWLVGVWHDVNLDSFEKYVEKVKTFDIEVKTVSEAFNEPKHED